MLLISIEIYRDFPDLGIIAVYGSFLLILYAETHYKFPGIYSRLWKKEPEIIADLPHRLEPGFDLPVLILVKDAHLYPIELIEVKIYCSENPPRLLHKRDYHTKIQSEIWHSVIDIKLPDDISGLCYFDVEIVVKVNGNTIVYRNDNYRLSSHAPFPVLIDSEKLPIFSGWHYGDLHYHSSFTSDQVEFGAPLEPTVHMAKALGLHFFAVTDHSYDLDDDMKNYLKNDPQAPKWQELWQEIHEINSSNNNFVIIPGEELSVGNSRNRNVHLLILNSRQLFIGAGDSAERWFVNKPEHKIAAVMQNIETGALCFAAHPETAAPFLQRLLIRRGKWEKTDYDHKRLNGLQIWNGKTDHFFQKGMQKWAELLLSGRRLSIIAGNDAHGNFGRFRQIGFPFLTFHEKYSETFAQAKTAVLLDKPLNQANLLWGLQKGKIAVTDGPLANMWFKRRDGSVCTIGDEINDTAGELTVTVKSTGSFGFLQDINLFIGDIAKKTEIRRRIDVPSGRYNHESRLVITDLPASGYIRLSVTSMRGDKLYSCYTNHMFFSGMGF